MKTKYMRTILGGSLLAALALVVLAAGCATSNLLDRENVAVGAGFKVITPAKPDQQALLRKLPADKVTRINYGGKTYFVLPDLQNNQAYVGGPKQYQAYQQLRQKQEKNSENHEWFPTDEQAGEINAMDWSQWVGWGAIGGMDDPNWY